jgi:hypothetical protein
LSYFKDLSSRVGIDKTKVEKESRDTKGKRRGGEGSQDMYDDLADLGKGIEILL